MKLEDIGFYTLSDYRATNSSRLSPLWRCELILTDLCNFKCPYCRGIRGDCNGVVNFEDAAKCVDLWIKEGLKNVRFSGGEPTLYPRLADLVKRAKAGGVEHIAISTNGSASMSLYDDLIEAGVNDFSVSLDGCCAAVGDKMAGRDGVWNHVIDTIKELSKKTYVTVGMVFTEENVDQCKESVLFAHSLGVSDIRVIPSAQYNKALRVLADLPSDVLDRYPILKYRIENINRNEHVRGMKETDCSKCHLMIDDMAVAGGKNGLKHFPCIIYLREGGDPVGEVGENMRKEREEWIHSHDCYKDPICKANCLDVCVAYNNKAGTVK